MPVTQSRQTTSPGHATTLPDTVVRALAFIRTHSDDRLTLARIAGAAGVTNRRLQKQFKLCLGVSPMAVLRDARLERAHADFLASTDPTRVTTVATDRGFSHLGRFSVAYRKAFLETPSATARAGPAGRQLIVSAPGAALAALLRPERWQAELRRAQRQGSARPDALALALDAFPLASVAEAGSAARALELCEQSADIDPSYALPRALAAWCHAQRVVYTWTATPAGEREKALGLAAEAVRLDSGDATVQTVLCATYAAIGDLPAAQASIAPALLADPASHWAWQRSAWLRTYRGEKNAARAEFQRALRADPTAPQVFNTYIGLGLVAFDAGEYRDAAGWIRLGLRASPTAVWSHRVLAAAEARLGHRDEARLSVGRLRRSDPDLSIAAIVATLPVNPDFLDRLADGLETAGMQG